MSEEKPIVKAAKIERIERPDGSVDIIVHVPRLAMKQAMKTYFEKKEQLKNG